jgi:hypothetical protein
VCRISSPFLNLTYRRDDSAEKVENGVGVFDVEVLKLPGPIFL